jgi:hypothetical protein
MCEKINKLKDMLVKDISLINDDILQNIKYIEKCKKKKIKKNDLDNHADLVFLLKEKELFMTKKTILTHILYFLEK